MLNPLRKLVLAASLGAGIASFASLALALPVLGALAIKNAAPPTLVEEVQWRGRWGWGWGAPVVAGVVAGALVGGALAAPAGLPLCAEAQQPSTAKAKRTPARDRPGAPG
jgi:heme A synthase